MGSFSTIHWLLVLAIVILVFGTKRLRTMGGDLGAAIRELKAGVADAPGEKPSATASSAVAGKPVGAATLERATSGDEPPFTSS